MSDVQPLEAGVREFWDGMTSRYSEPQMDGETAQYARGDIGFTKKHFIAFAKHIKGLRDEGNHVGADAIHNMVLSLNDNPRFDAERFATAAGGKPGEHKDE